MNGFQVACAQCRARFAAKPQLAGKRVKCPKCGAPIDVPLPDVIELIEVQCPTCFTDFQASAYDGGRDVTCPTCGMAVSVGGAASAAKGNPFRTGADPLGRRNASSLAPARALHIPAQPRRAGGDVPSGAALWARFWPSVAVAGIGLLSFVIALFTGRLTHGVVLLMGGVIVAGIGVVFPSSARKPRAKKKSKTGSTIGSTIGVGLAVFSWFMFQAGREGRSGRFMAIFLALSAALVILIGMIVGYVLAIIRFGFFRPTAVLYAVFALGLPALWIAFTSRISTVDLPQTVNVRDEPVPTFASLGTARPVAPGVDLREIRLQAPAGQPGYAGRIRVYTPAGSHAARSLPCVFITGAGALIFTGMELGDEDSAEHLPYVQAGFAVVAYETDGYLAEAETATNQQYVEAIGKYWASQAGMINARNAIEFALAKVPEIDPARLYTAGHSSAAVQALLLASNDSRIKGCVAYAPVCDYEAHGADVVRDLRRIIRGFDTLLQMASPRANESHLNCPVFLFHAQDDSNVPVTESTAMAARLKAAGKQVTLVTVPFGDHYDAMISQGIPQGITWLGQLAGSPGLPFGPTPEPGVPPSPGRIADGRPGPANPLMPGPSPGLQPPVSGGGADSDSPFRPVGPDSGDGADSDSPFRPVEEGGMTGTGGPVDQLISRLADDNVFDRRKAIQEVSRLESDTEMSDKQRATLIKRLNNLACGSDPFDQREALHALETWGDASSVDILIGLLDDDRSRTVRSDAYRVLGQLKDPRAAAPVARKIGDFFDKKDAQNCIRALGPLAEDALIAVAPSNDADTCLAAITLLGEVGTEKCLQMLRDAQRSKNQVVRETAKVAVRNVRSRHPEGSRE